MNLLKFGLNYVSAKLSLFQAMNQSHASDKLLQCFEIVTNDMLMVVRANSAAFSKYITKPANSLEACHILE